jgi:hypothetical protein
MYPVTIAPDEDTPLPSLFVVAVADTKVPPQAWPVADNRPAELTVNICGVFEDQVTWLVMSLVTGGWMYVPRALSCSWNPASAGTGIFEAPTVSTVGWIWIEVSSWGSPQLETLSSEIATIMRATVPNHFAFMKAPGTEGPS